jgi:hypothetical protein
LNDQATDIPNRVRACQFGELGVNPMSQLKEWSRRVLSHGHRGGTSMIRLAFGGNFEASDPDDPGDHTDPALLGLQPRPLLNMSL